MPRKTALIISAATLPLIMGMSPMQKGGTITVEQGQTGKKTS